jgi:hypothetical protein
MVYESEEQFSESGEAVGKWIKTALNGLVYFLVGVVLVGGLSSVYLFVKGVGYGWKKAGKVKTPQ